MGSTFRIWSLSSGRLLREFETEGSGVQIFNRDGRARALSQSKESGPVIWDLETGSLLSHFSTPALPLTSFPSDGLNMQYVLLAEDAVRLMGVSLNGRIEIWDSATRSSASSQEAQSSVVDDFFRAVDSSPPYVKLAFAGALSSIGLAIILLAPYLAFKFLKPLTAKPLA
jgi:WD40 repeat protein